MAVGSHTLLADHKSQKVSSNIFTNDNMNELKHYKIMQFGIILGIEWLIFFQKHEKLIYSAWQKFSLKKHNFYKKLTKQFFQ